MPPLAYVCVRPELEAATAEHASFQRALGVSTGDLDRIDLLSDELPERALDSYAGFVIGGSPFNVTDAAKSDVQVRVERDLERIARAALDGRTAAFFTCYGIGVATRMLGGTVGLDTPEPTSASQVSATADAATDPIFGPAGASYSALTAHKEGSRAVPPGAVLLGTNDTCPVQAYRVGDRLYATQFHPEPTPRDFADRMHFYRSTGYFDPTAFDAVAAAVLQSDVTEPPQLLRRFAQTFAA